MELRFVNYISFFRFVFVTASIVARELNTEF